MVQDTKAAGAWATAARATRIHIVEERAHDRMIEARGDERVIRRQAKATTGCVGTPVRMNTLQRCWGGAMD